MSWLQADEAEGAGGQECVEAEGRERALLGLRSRSGEGHVPPLKVLSPGPHAQDLWFRERCLLKAVSSVKPSLTTPTDTSCTSFFVKTSCLILWCVVLVLVSPLDQ